MAVAQSSGSARCSCETRAELEFCASFLGSTGFLNCMLWRKRHQRVPQPPVQASLRSPERHDFWPGAILAVVAAVLLFCGVRHVTGVETTDGESAREHELVKAFARSGLQLAPPPRPPDPASYEDPAAAAAALERFAREESSRPRLKYRVNTGAVDPCPT